MHKIHFEYLLQDVRFAIRTLRKSWGFALTAILTLALGIGANTAIFQLVDAVRLRSLPVADPWMLAGVRVKSGTRGFGITAGDYDTMLSYPMWQQIRLHQQSFSGVFAWSPSSWISMGEGAQERRAQTLWASGEMFSVLGVAPIRGRTFTEKDDQPNCGLPGVVISYGLWQSEFGGQDLHRNVAVEPRVARPVDLPHSARPDRRDDLIRPQARAGSDCHREG